MAENRQIKKGNIYVYDFGGKTGNEEAGRRPALVVQDHRVSMESPTTIVAPISSSIKKLNLPAHVWLGADYGLRRESIVLLEQVRTVNKKDLGKYIGTVDDIHTKTKIESGLRKQFGIRKQIKAEEESIRCLCPKCLADYRATDAYIIRRVDPYDETKDTCIKCGRMGHDYFVVPKGDR